MSLIDPETVGRYVESGWWGTDPLHRLVREQAARTPDADAYITPSARTSWATYDSVADDLAATLVALGIPVGDRVAVQLPDTFLVHAALVATARAGVVAVGIGARAGDREIAHLVRKTGARALVTLDALAGRSSSVLVRELRDLGLPLAFHVVLSDRGVEGVFDVSGRTAVPVPPGRADRADVDGRSFGPNDLNLLNSTSGTTGLPKCVTQFDNRGWRSAGWRSRPDTCGATTCSSVRSRRRSGSGCGRRTTPPPCSGCPRWCCRSSTWRP